MKTEIAPVQPFNEGIPRLHNPGIYGASPSKPFLCRIPVTGKMPIVFNCFPALPDGLVLDVNTGIIAGCVTEPGEYRIRIKAANELGADEKSMCIRIAEDGICRTPLLGWTSWNAFSKDISQDIVKTTAEMLISTGLAMYGYQYVNIDSGWQGEYGGQYNAIQPNAKFPDMKALAEHIHSLGLKIGIYSTPMQKAWGGGEYPGCTRGKLDMAYANTHYGVGTARCERNNADQWVDWGIDYLKYDWSPCDVKNASLMKECLIQSKRDFAYCITVSAGIENAQYWKKHCSSWRSNIDSEDNWENVKSRFLSDPWAVHCNPGHYYDLDMLETGVINKHICKLTEDEQLVSFSIRALFPSPIQISCDLNKLTEFDLALLCNDEILAVNQDALGIGAACISELNSQNLEYREVRKTKIYLRPLEDGAFAAGFFNLGEIDEEMSLALSEDAVVRDLWARKDLCGIHGSLKLKLAPHTVRMMKIHGTP